MLRLHHRSINMKLYDETCKQSQSSGLVKGATAKDLRYLVYWAYIAYRKRRTNGVISFYVTILPESLLTQRPYTANWEWVGATSGSQLLRITFRTIPLAIYRIIVCIKIPRFEGLMAVM